MVWGKTALWLGLEPGISLFDLLQGSWRCNLHIFLVLRVSKETHLEANMQGGKRLGSWPRAFLVLQEWTAWLQIANIKVKVSGNSLQQSLWLVVQGIIEKSRIGKQTNVNVKLFYLIILSRFVDGPSIMTQAVDA